MKIYLPQTESVCSIVLDQDTIRDYKTINLNQENNYTDYYINSHYLAKEGTENLQIQPSCIDPLFITDDFYYRNDIVLILIYLLIVCYFIFIIPIKVMLRLFRRFN